MVYWIIFGLLLDSNITIAVIITVKNILIIKIDSIATPKAINIVNKNIKPVTKPSSNAIVFVDGDFFIGVNYDSNIVAMHFIG